MLDGLGWGERLALKTPRPVEMTTAYADRLAQRRGEGMAAGVASSQVTTLVQRTGSADDGRGVVRR